MGTAGAVEGKVAWVTGAARGQGRAHAVALAAEGADVIVTDLCADIDTVPYALGTAAELAETVALVEAEGRRCLSMVADVRDTAALDAVVAAGTEAFGHIDICVANAGVTGYGRFHELDDTTWQDMIDVDLTGTFRTIRAVLPHMLERRFGRVIATASMARVLIIPITPHLAAT